MKWTVLLVALCLALDAAAAQPPSIAQIFSKGSVWELHLALKKVPDPLVVMGLRVGTTLDRGIMLRAETDLGGNPGYIIAWENADRTGQEFALYQPVGSPSLALCKGSISADAANYKMWGNTTINQVCWLKRPVNHTAPPERTITYLPEKPTTQDKIKFVVTATDQIGVQRIDLRVLGETTWEQVKTCTFPPGKLSVSCDWLGGPFVPSSRGNIGFNAIACDTAGNCFPWSNGAYEIYIPILR